MVVALRSEMLVARLYFTTPTFDGPEERIYEDELEFGIRGDYRRRKDLE